MQRIIVGLLLKSVKIHIRWRKQTKLSPTLGGREKQVKWHGQPLLIDIVTLASWLTSMLEKQRQQNAFCTILESPIKLVKSMKGLLPWTGWSRNKSVE